MKHRIQYIAPSLADIGKLVNKTFDRLSKDDPTFNAPVMRHGFTQFMWRVAIVVSKHLSTNSDETDVIDKTSK